ncbi:hypothetical protein HY68_25840 [Streptomyces sp. AcH 505]|uniref:effector-associated domain 2-containing protein n=1 Tax=Streptomyces sp. AcH 505 TaxID=352211 RepID=UPI000591BF2B|nr:hypothetical protein HY68_25840 [Streptomyces sp. AcH 505]
MTDTAVAPARVFALVVGIERYAAGDTWTLPGPARDAVRFRAWLRAAGVPEHNILLHLAPAGGYDPGVAYRPADHAALRRALVGELPALRGDALWIWWGGHGVLDQDERIRLYCADATEADRRNLDLESARRALSSDALPGFARQTWVVDACQTFEERHGFPLSLPAETLPAGERVHAHQQALLLAVTRGQRAANDPVGRTGLFSDVVLGELGAEAAPDPGPLFARVAARMDALRADGVTEQTPSVFLRGPGLDTSLPAPRAQARPGAGSPMLRLVEALLAYPMMGDRDERQTLVSALDPGIVARLPRHAVPRTDLVNLARTLGRRPDDLWQLYDAVTLLDDDPRRSDELRRAISELNGGTGGPR